MITPQETETKRIKREILVRLIKAFYSEDFGESARRIPYDMRPKGCEVPYRCCVYKERAILKARTLAGLGISLEDDDECTLMNEYARQAVAPRPAPKAPLTVVESACQGCAPSRVYVTELCQNCVARPCMSACKFGAIIHEGGRSFVDPAKCKKCGMCINACPYGAIVKTVVPCENACPVDAISKDESGMARINPDKCISCGKCVSACPFGAVNARSQLIDVLSRIREGRETVAMIAPAIVGQLPCTAEQLHTALKKIGFKYVYEVAQGADITARTEAHDLQERLERGDAFMTTSCCAAYNELVAKHLPEIKPFVSDTKTPMYYTAEIAKREHPEAVTVFLSPCFAKRREALGNPNVDYVLSFEELGATFIALGVDVASCEGEEYEVSSSKEGRNFPLTGGVAASVAAAWRGEEGAVKPTTVNGLTKASIRDLKRWAKTGKCELGNLIEIMSCEGGCIGGNACLSAPKPAMAQVKEYSGKSFSLSDAQANA